MIRSLLFAPANRADLVVKFPRFAADCCVIDLEDGTPPGDKRSAREMLRDTVNQVRLAGLTGMLTVRVNIPASPHYLADIEAALNCDVDGIVIPKLESPEQAVPAVHWIHALDAQAPRVRPRTIVGGIESVRGVLNAVDICARTACLGSVYFGAEDLAADAGGRRTPRGDEVYTARSMVLLAAKAAQIIAIDQAVVDIRDDALFLADAVRGRDLGYDGKICVTPGQVKLSHRAFSPSLQEREYAGRLVAACESAAANGVGTIDFEGRMIDGPLLKRAQAILGVAAARLIVVNLDIGQLDLAAHVRPGDGIVFGQGCGEPLSLTERLVEQRAAYSGAGLFFGSGFSRTFQPEHADHLRFKGIGGIGTLRKLASAGKLDPVPCHISAIEDLIRGGQIRCDVVLLQVSPADQNGMHSFGLVNDYLRVAMSRARVVIAEVNRQIPWTPCDQPLRHDEISVAVATDRAPLELPAVPFGALERRIASHLADMIPERATLQVGIGAVPEAIVAMLSDRRGLGVHSGMIGDSVADLMQRGVITNEHKSLDPGVTISGVLFGTQRLYRFAHRNPQLRLCPTSYTHAAGTLCQLQRLVSINSALEVDLTGQVNAEAIGSEYIGAVGGQVDFVRAAARCEGGVSIIALPAIGKGGDSKIVARLSGPVTTPRSDVDVIATEHGAVRLRGLGLAARMRALVSLAAPEHREGLLREARDVWGAPA